MSVIAFDTNFFSQIAADLKHLGYFDLTLADKRTYAFAFSDVSEETFRRRIIDQFVRRLYFANQMAYCITYEKDDDRQFVIELPELWKTMTPRDRKSLVKDLWSLDYNLVSNGGSTFIGREDDDRLQGVIRAIEHELASEVSRD